VRAAALGACPSRPPPSCGFRALLIVPFAAALLLPAAAHAGVVTPQLQARLAQAAPDEAVPVIATLARQIDPAAYAGDPDGLIAAEMRLADETQPEVIAAAGVPVTRFWITNAVAFAAPPEAILRVAGLPSVGTVDLTQTAVAATPPPPNVSGASLTPALRAVRISSRPSPAGRMLQVAGVLQRPGRVRATLHPVPRRPGAAPALVRSAAGPGRFRMSLPLRRLTRGAYRLTVQATTPSGRPAGPPTTRRVRVG
jgi:hypothetical protein